MSRYIDFLPSFNNAKCFHASRHVTTLNVTKSFPLLLIIIKLYSLLSAYEFRWLGNAVGGLHENYDHIVFPPTAIPFPNSIITIPSMFTRDALLFSFVL